MEFKVSENFKDRLISDLDNKYLGHGVKLGGSINDNKVKLYTTDDYGKHSNFATRIFHGKLNGNVLSGKFSISLYAALLLGILTVFCLESIVTAIISGSAQSIILPAAIIVIEIIYFFSLKRISAENDEFIKKYLEACIVED